VTLFLFNRGDAGNISRASFARLVEAAEGRVGDWAGMEAVEIRTPHARGADRRVRRRAWVKDAYRVDLACAYTALRSSSPSGTRFRAEYVRLTVTPFDADDDPRTRPIAMRAQYQVISPFALRDRVERRPNGDVVITGVPMVDQGDKGYCAVATAERLLRYYRRDVDQHQLAQAADTSAHQGTDPDTMKKALRGLCHRLGLKFRVLVDFEADDFLRLIKDYNRQAAKTGSPAVDEGGPVIDLARLYQSMQPDTLLSTRVRNRSALRSFEGKIVKHVDGGVPLAWSVMVGTFPESPPLRQLAGGHLRLIIGYHAAANEVLYTDSWGAGHELKRMPLDQAWAITTGLYTVMPENIRL
jgi:hypothetical protein